MEKILRELEEMKKQMDKKHEQIKENITEQIGQLKRKILEEGKAREKENREKGRFDRKRKGILELEITNEKKEKESRTNNIVIKEVDWKPEVSKLEVNDFLKESLKLEVELQNLRTLNINGKSKSTI